MRDRSQQQSPSEVVAALSDLVLHPAQTFYPSWNWKSALLSAMLRADAVIAASSALAQTFFRAVVGFGLQSPGSKIPSPRYVHMVPSVTGREEKSAVTLHPRRAD